MNFFKKGEREPPCITEALKGKVLKVLILRNYTFIHAEQSRREVYNVPCVVLLAKHQSISKTDNMYMLPCNLLQEQSKMGFENTPLKEIINSIPPA
jgi:hypothetical protein